MHSTTKDLISRIATIDISPLTAFETLKKLLERYRVGHTFLEKYLVDYGVNYPIVQNYPLVVRQCRLQIERGFQRSNDPGDEVKVLFNVLERLLMVTTADACEECGGGPLWIFKDEDHLFRLCEVCDASTFLNGEPYDASAYMIPTTMELVEGGVAISLKERMEWHETFGAITARIDALVQK